MITDCITCIYNYNIKPCNLKNRIINMQVQCSFYLAKLKDNENKTVRKN